MSPLLGAAATIAGCVLVALAGLLLFRRALPPSELSPHRDSVGVFTTIIATIYAVVLAFVVVIVWQQYDDTRSAVSREGDALIDLARLAATLPPPANEQVRRELITFAQTQVDREWPSLAQGVVSPETEQALNALWLAFTTETTVAPPAGQAILETALRRLTDLSDSRRLILNASAAVVPAVLWALLLGGAAINIGFTYMLGVESLRWHVVMTILLAAEIGFVLFVIATLDNPFSPGAALSQEPLLRAIRLIPTIQ